MRGVPLRSPYHLYQKKNKSVSCFLAYKLIIRGGVYEKVMCNRPLGFYIYKDTGKMCPFYGENLKLI